MNIPSAAPVFVAGGETLLGAALVRTLAARGFSRVLAPLPDAPRLTDPAAVESFFAEMRPHWVFLAAGRSAGIDANRRLPATLMRDNLLVTTHVLEAARRHGARKLLYLASSCCYPRDCPQPMRVESLMAGPLEPTNDAYALAKLAGIRLCQAYRSEHGTDCIVGIPANAYGPGDDFSAEDSHVVAGLIRRLHEAKASRASAVTLWGTGRSRREFVYADDLAEACLLLMERYSGETPVNVGGGSELTIAELADRIRDVVGFAGELRYDRERPDGMPVKVLDSAVLAGLGFRARTPIGEGLERTYCWFLEHEALR